MILPAAFLVDDAWTWDVSLRYDDREGVLLNDRERWTLKVGKALELTAERTFVGTVVPDGTLIPSPAAKPEILKGKIEADGTLAVKGDWSDRAATKALRRLLRGEKGDDRLPGWPVARRLTVVERDARPPGGDAPCTLRIDVALASARLGGKEIRVLPFKP